MENQGVVLLSDYIDSNSPAQKFKDFKPSSILQKRVISFAIDITVIAFIKFIFTIAYASFIKTFFYQLDLKTQISLVEGINIFNGFSSLLIFSSYFTFSHFMGEGKTIGKMLTKTTVVDNNFIKNFDTQDKNLTLKKSLLRMIGYFTAYITFGIPFIPAFFRDDKKSWPDFISRSQTLDDGDIHTLLLLKSADIKELEQLVDLPEAA